MLRHHSPRHRKLRDNRVIAPGKLGNMAQFRDLDCIRSDNESVLATLDPGLCCGVGETDVHEAGDDKGESVGIVSRGDFGLDELWLVFFFFFFFFFFWRLGGLWEFMEVRQTGCLVRGHIRSAFLER